MIPTPPTGISVVTYSDEVVINWVQNPETDIQGYNVYNSTTSGGGQSGYVKLNNTLVETYSSIENNVINTQQTIQITGDIRTTTTTDTLQQLYIYSYSHMNITEQVTQYYIITAVNTAGEESVASIEVQATPFVVPTSTITIPIRTQNDVALTYITELLERNANLDVKPGSVVRQLHVDPNSAEFYWAYVRENFAMRSQSFLMLRAIDDPNNTGVSIAVADSPYKQLLGQAYFYTSDTDIQALIDNAFDALASNYGTIRQGATYSTTNVIFYTLTIPTADLTVTLNAIASTTTTENVPAVSFETLSSGIMSVAQINTYYNAITQRYELSIPVQAVVAGSSGEVNLNTIINTNIAGFSVTNPQSTFGGFDEESNSDLADRVQLAFAGLDVGTAYGYKKTCTDIPGIRDVVVVTAGDPLMQRDYDEVRKKHVYGKVDIYIRGGENTQFQDTIGFLFKQAINEQFTITYFDVTNWIFTSTNPAVTSLIPIFYINNVKNATKGRNYDILGDWMIFKNLNLIAMVKTTEVSLILATGAISFTTPLTALDEITANYNYKVVVTGEVIISPASGGEASFVLDNTPILKHSYSIIKNGTVLTDTTDYNLILSTGHLTLTQALSLGDILTTNYTYIVQVVGEIVIAIAAGGEISANLAHSNILESIIVGANGVSIELDPNNEINSGIGLLNTDLIYVTYRYRASDPILLSTQPAESIISIVGSVSGPLQAGINYELNKFDDVLLEGNSSQADRTVQIIYANGIPNGAYLTDNETIVLVNNEYKQLTNYGIDTTTIVVQQGVTIFYINSDYLILPETSSSKVQIARSVTSTIPNGTPIQVSYSYGEILNITYNANSLVNVAQAAINVSRHVTADVLVKEVLETFIDLTISVVVTTGVDTSKIVSDIETAISNAFDKLKLGQGIAQSDVISVVENVTNVVSVIVPFNKMVKADGTQINRELIATSFNIYSSNTVTSYIAINALLCNTLGNAAADGFYAIFEDDRPLTLLTDPTQVDLAPGQGYIGTVDTYENNCIVISTLDGDSPSLHKFTVCYAVNGETGAKDIDITSLEYLSVGETIITTA